LLHEISKDNFVWKFWCLNHFGFEKQIKCKEKEYEQQPGLAAEYARLFKEFGRCPLLHLLISYS
jgi:hypothetical protein